MGNIHCKNCGYIGVQSDFSGDHCPQCKAALRTPAVRYARCKECGRKVESGKWTCPYCGHTQWIPILITGGAAFICILFTVVVLPLPSFWTILFGAIGIGLFYSFFFSIGQALSWRRWATFSTTSLVLGALLMFSLAARYRWSADPVFFEKPSAVVAAAAMTETPVPAITLGPTLEPSPSPTPETTAVILATLANIRSGPGTDFDNLGTVALDEVITILGRSADTGWVKIKSKAGTEGWVWRPLIQLPVDVKILPEVK